MRHLSNHYACDTYPTADILINTPHGQNQVKKYGNAIYLADRTEFVILLDNNTSETWLAKIELNGSSISDSGIVLRPGERVDLERYIDEPKKFIFETYDVPKGRAPQLKNNGLVIVKFFREMHYAPITRITYWANTSWPGSSGSYPYWQEDWSYRGSTTDPKTFYSDSKYPETIQAFHSAQSQTFNMVKEETGRVEKGNHSNQQFQQVDRSFEIFASHTVEYKLFPLSQKNLTRNEIRVYCSGCGRRQRPGDNFCPKCGKKF